jgi:FlaA1/EpsC-like NDP-sugar epimerase
MKKNELLNDLFSFEDRVIIITGGAGAIGSALAELLGNLVPTLSLQTSMRSA